MLSNFMYSNKKIDLNLYTPKKPSLIDGFECFRFSVLMGCSISLLYYSLNLLALITFMAALGVFAFMALRFVAAIAVRQYIYYLKRLKEIYETPVYKKQGELTTYTFIAPSEILLDKIIKFQQKT